MQAVASCLAEKFSFSWIEQSGLLSPGQERQGQQGQGPQANASALPPGEQTFQARKSAGQQRLQLMQLLSRHSQRAFS